MALLITILYVKHSQREKLTVWHMGPSDCDYAHADLNILLLYMSEGTFSYVAAQLYLSEKTLYK